MFHAAHRLVCGEPMASRAEGSAKAPMGTTAGAVGGRSADSGSVPLLPDDAIVWVRLYEMNAPVAKY
jgi:hypothetical protein